MAEKRHLVNSAGSQVFEGNMAEEAYESASEVGYDSDKDPEYVPEATKEGNISIESSEVSYYT